VLFANCKLFRDIAQLNSVSRGAAENEISQSAASQHLQDLERRLGATLLDRSTRPLTVTPAGRLYLDLCRDVLRREEEFQQSLEALAAPQEVPLRVASIYSVALTDMARLREEFEKSCEGVRLDVEYWRPDLVYQAVLNGKAELGLVSYPEARRDLTIVPWRAEPMVVAVRPDHPFASRVSLVPKDLDGEQYVGFDEELAIRRELDRFLRGANVQVQVAMHFDNIQMVKEAVALGQGISILPDRTMQLEIEQRRLVAVPMKAPGLFRPVGIIHRRRKLSRAAATFVDLLLGSAVPALAEI
jgi:LysR family transcriptional regulator, transcriptional activator of the cysJI operon